MRTLSMFTIAPEGTEPANTAPRFGSGDGVGVGVGDSLPTNQNTPSGV